jgi:hypothetical protein
MMKEATASYFANLGPSHGPILGRDHSRSLGVFHTSDASHLPIGIAYPTGLAPGRTEPVRTFRLVIDKVALDGWWKVDHRKFVRLGPGAEEASP